MIKSKKSITIALVVFIISLFLVGTLAVLTDMDKSNRVSALAGSVHIELNDDSLDFGLQTGELLMSNENRPFSYTISHKGNKSIDVRESIYISYKDPDGNTIPILYFEDPDTTNITHPISITEDGNQWNYELSEYYVRFFNNESILSGSEAFTNREQELDDTTGNYYPDNKTTNVSLATTELAGLANYQVCIDIVVEAKQHRNTSWFSDNTWAQIQAETMTLSNGVDIGIVDEATGLVIPVVGPTDPELKDWSYRLNNETNEIQLFKYTGNYSKSGKVVVNGTYTVRGETYNTVISSTNSSPFKNDKYDITNVVFENGVTIKDAGYMFANCTNLSYVDLSNIDTSAIADMTGMFDGCNNVTINVATEADETKIATVAPTGCTITINGAVVDNNQYEIDITKFQTLAQAKTGTITFSTTPLTTQIGTDLSATGDGSIIGVEDGENVTIYSKNGKTYAPEDSSTMFQMFKATSIDCSGLDTSNVMYMNWMFGSCENLASLDLSSFDTFMVEDVELAFAYCENLRTLDLSSWDFSNIYDLSDTFTSCKGLTIYINSEETLAIIESLNPNGEVTFVIK